MSTAPSLRIVFAGTPAFAAQHLQALATSRHEVVGVFTQPDRPAGRGKKLTASPVKQLAQQLSLPIFQPETFKSDDARTQLESLAADVMVVVAYGLILPQAALDIPRLGCINVHASLLPRWRGAAPVQRALAAGDTESGVTIMQMEAGLDTGPMLKQQACTITANDTSETLLNKLADLGCQALLITLEELAANSTQPQPQDNRQATYAEKIDKAEAMIDWRRSTQDIDRLIRAFIPFPIAYGLFGEQRIKIYRATIDHSDNSGNALVEPGIISAVDIEHGAITVSCGNGLLSLLDIQLPGKKAMPVKAVLLGNRDLFTVGAKFSLPTVTSTTASDI